MQDLRAIDSISSPSETVLPPRNGADLPMPPALAEERHDGFGREIALVEAELAPAQEQFALGVVRRPAAAAETGACGRAEDGVDVADVNGDANTDVLAVCPPPANLLHNPRFVHVAKVVAELPLRTSDLHCYHGVLIVRAGQWAGCRVSC